MRRVWKYLKYASELILICVEIIQGRFLELMEILIL